MSNLILSSKPIEISEYGDYKIATFLISVLDEWDCNHRLIPKNVGEKYHDSIVGFPIVAKLITDKNGEPIDFKGHEARLYKDKNGEIQTKFGTTPIGSVLQSWIEEREISGYEGKKSCIMIKAKLWTSRFPQYFEVLDKLWAEDNVASSWEMMVEDSKSTPKGKIIKAFHFIGNALLGRSVQGAVPGAGVCEYAEQNDVEFSEYIELANALSNDVIQNSNINNEEQEDKMEENKANVTIAEDTPEDVQSNEQTQETSALTIRDIYRRLQMLVEKSKADIWVTFVYPTENFALAHTPEQDELEYWKFSYSIDESDNLTIDEPISVKLVVSVAQINEEIAIRDNALIEANTKINLLKDEIAELQICKNELAEIKKAQVEKELAEKRETLKQYALSSKQITSDELESDETMRLMISELNEAGIKSIISDRFIASLANVTVDTSEIYATSAKADIDIDAEVVDAKVVIKKFLNRN